MIRDGAAKRNQAMWDLYDAVLRVSCSFQNITNTWFPIFGAE